MPANFMHFFYFLFLFYFLKTGFHHVGQAGLELLTSGDLPASTSQSAGLQARATVPGIFFLKKPFYYRITGYFEITKVCRHIQLVHDTLFSSVDFYDHN